MKSCSWWRHAQRLVPKVFIRICVSYLTLITRYDCPHQRRRPLGLHGLSPLTWKRMMKTLIIALTLSTLIAPPAFTQSAIEAPRVKMCDASQPREDSGGAYPGYPLTWCYWW
jgi:hypothetical protein